MRQRSHPISSLGLLMLILAGGCGSPNSHGPVAANRLAPQQHEAVLPAGIMLPELPEAGLTPDGTPRQISVNLSVQLDGVDFDQTNVIPDSTSSLQMLPNSGELGPFLWAIYRFDGLSADASVSTLSAALSDLTPDEQYYFALADYELAGWEYFARTAENPTATYNFAADFDPLRHISAANSVYFAVLTWELPATIDFVSLQASTSLTAPQNVAASDGEDGSAVHLTWDAVPGAQMFEVFYKEADQPDEFYGFLADTIAATEEPGLEHTADFPVGKPAVFGVEYEYKVRATADGEDPSPFSAPDTGLRQFPAPYFFTASDRIDHERVIVGWRSPPSGPGLREFKAFRDEVLLDPPGLLQVGDAFAIADYVGDYAEHEYYVVETGPDGDGPPSAIDVGSAGEWETQVVVTVDSTDRLYADMEPAAHDPSIPAVCYMLEATTQLMYGWLSGGTKTVHEVAQADPDGTNALTNHLGRPWIAYYNQEPGLGTQGVYIARAQTPQPLSGDDWDTYLVQAGDLASEELVLEVVGNRLALAFTEHAGTDDYPLHYLYALVDDPTGPDDWGYCVIDTFEAGSHSAARLDIAEWQGLPLVARQGSYEGFLCQASSLTPTDAGDWTSYELPLEGGAVSLAKGLELAVEDGRVYVFGLEASPEGVGRMLVSRPQNWPPGPADWLETHFNTEDNVDYQGLSTLFVEGRPFIALSPDNFDGPEYVFPAMVGEEELTWDLSQWAVTEVPMDPKYNRATQENSLRYIDGDLCLLHISRYSDGGTKYDLLYSRLKPGA